MWSIIHFIPGILSANHMEGENTSDQALTALTLNLEGNLMELVLYFGEN
jgi:hypothetical protein